MNDFAFETSPLICLGLPVYNGEKFVGDAIRSILVQDHKNFELIITDNASTDSTEKICREFAASDPRVRYVRNQRNLGAGPNHNLAFELSRGKYFKWCACDDRISENFLSACLAALEKDTDAILAYGITQTIDEDGRLVPLVGRMMKAREDSNDPGLRFKKDLIDRATNFEIFGLIRSDALRKTTMHRPYYGSDKALMTELALLGKFVFVPGIVFYNREHKDRSINIKDKHVLANWQDTAAQTNGRPVALQRIEHLIEIAFRHGAIVSPIRTLTVIFVWAFQTWSLRTARRIVYLAETGLTRVLN